MTDISYPKLIAAGLVQKDNKYLLVKETFKDGIEYWIVPGGKVEYGELLELAVIREIAEEVGLFCQIEKFLGFKEAIFPHYHTIIFFYLIKIKSGRLSLAVDEGILESKFVTKKQALKLKLADSARWLFENYI